MSHFSVAVFTKTVFEKPSEELKKLKEAFMSNKEKNPDFLIWKAEYDKEQVFYNKEFEKMDKEVRERTLKYMEYGVSDEIDKILNKNEYLEWIVDEDEEEEGYFNNPNSFWDWFKIGGRWCDLAEEIHYKKIKDLSINLILESFYGFIDLDNNYHSKGEMGWWGADDSTEESVLVYYDKFKKYLENNPELYIIVVDFHV